MQSRDKKESMKVYGFVHVYMINNWREIISEQLSKMFKSKLWGKIDKLFVGLVGQEKESDIIRDLSEFIYDKIKIIYCINKPDIYEALTLSFLHHFSMVFDGYVFYIHTKGVTRKDLCFSDWRRMMEYYILERHESCIRELESCDVVGVNWHLGEGYMNASYRKAEGTEVTPHFSGNFWWADTKYIRRLPPLYPLKSKYECEFWIGKRYPIIGELWNSGIHHHRKCYPFSLYEGKENVRYYQGRIRWNDSSNN